MVYLPSDTSLEKSNFSYASGYQLEIASELRMDRVSTFLFSSRDLVQCRPSVSSCVPDLLCLEGLDTSMSIPSDFLTLSASSSMSSLIPEGRELMELSLTGLSSSRSHSLQIVCLWSLYLFLSAAGGSFSDDG